MTYDVPREREGFERTIEQLLIELTSLLFRIYGYEFKLFLDDFIEIDFRDNSNLTIRSNLIYTECVDEVVNTRSNREFQVVLTQDEDSTTFVEVGEWVFYLYRLKDNLTERLKEREILDGYRAFFTS